MAFSLANRSPSLAAIHGLGVGLGVCKRGCTREEPHAEAPRAARSWAGLSRGARGRVEQSENGAGSGPVGSGWLSRDCGSPDSSCRNEVVVPMLPGNRERVQDQSLRGLPTSASLFHCMNRSRRYASVQGEFILGPAECLSRCANPVHGVLAKAAGGRRMIAPPGPNWGGRCGAPRRPGPGPGRTARSTLTCVGFIQVTDFN